LRKTIVCLLIAFHGSVMAAEPEKPTIPEWHMAKSTMKNCYDGWDVEVTVSGGYETRYYENGPVDGAFGNAVLTVPLYSRKERLSRQESTNKEIEHIAELYADFEEQSASYAALSEEKDLLKKVMIDSGAQGITAYYNLMKEIEKARAKRNSAARKIMMILENCGYVETDKIAGPRPAPGGGSPSTTQGG